MEPNQAEFVYSDDILISIERRISKERLRPYLVLASNDRAHAVKFYEWNTLLSESLYGLLQGFEVVLRNTFHEVLTEAFGRPDWYDRCGLKRVDKENVLKAKQRILGEKKPITADRVVSELFFGFWVSLTRAEYARSLWDAHLHKAFTPAMKRQNAYHSLDRIRKLRNRVAHHEIILRPNLMDEYSLTIQAITMICPITARWIKSNTTFVEKYKQKPQKPSANVATTVEKLIHNPTNIAQAPIPKDIIAPPQ
jgi:hypothetical protein